MREKKGARQSDAAQLWTTWRLDRIEHVAQLHA